MYQRKIVVGVTLAVALIVGITILHLSREQDETRPRAAMSVSGEVADQASERQLSVDADGNPILSGSAGNAMLTLHEQQTSAALDAMPPETTIGPDGKPRPIVYNQAIRLSDQQLAQMKQALVDDMRRHPDAFAEVYGLEAEEVDQILQGKRELPQWILDQIAVN